MRGTMQFQLSDTFSNHLIKYDDVRKKTIKQQPKKPKKPNPYPFGLPPLDQLIPYDSKANINQGILLIKLK